MNKVTGRSFAPCRNVKRRSRHPVCRVSFCVFVWSLARRSSHRLCRPEATRRQEGWKDRQKTAWIPLRSGRFEMQEKRPRDRGKGLTPAHRQRARTGGAGTAHPRFAAGADQKTPAAASDLSAAAAEFSGLVFTAAIADGRAHAPCGIVLTEAKIKETGSWPHRKTVDAARLFHRSRASGPRKGSGNGHLCQRVKCAHLNTITTSKEIHIYGYYSKQRDMSHPRRTA